MEEGEILDEHNSAFSDGGSLFTSVHSYTTDTAKTTFKGCSPLKGNYEILEQVGQGTFGYFQKESFLTLVLCTKQKTYVRIQSLL